MPSQSSMTNKYFFGREIFYQNCVFICLLKRNIEIWSLSEALFNTENYV